MECPECGVYGMCARCRDAIASVLAPTRAGVAPVASGVVYVVVKSDRWGVDWCVILGAFSTREQAQEIVNKCPDTDFDSKRGIIAMTLNVEGDYGLLVRTRRCDQRPTGRRRSRIREARRRIRHATDALRGRECE